MTRKDFVLIAEAIKASAPIVYAAPVDECTHSAMNQHKDTAKSVANALARTNDRFDRERFLKACGVN